MREKAAGWQAAFNLVNDWPFSFITAFARLTLSPVALVLQSVADIKERPANDREDQVHYEIQNSSEEISFLSN